MVAHMEAIEKKYSETFLTFFFVSFDIKLRRNTIFTLRLRSRIIRISFGQKNICMDYENSRINKIPRDNETYYKIIFHEHIFYVNNYFNNVSLDSFFHYLDSGILSDRKFPPSVILVSDILYGRKFYFWKYPL